ncbi:DUF3179 domain-containing protein [bacterium]|nr:DUF3179 domain-containing protein [bacterium]
MMRPSIALAVLPILLLSACSDPVDPAAPRPGFPDHVLVDRDGRRWDVQYALEELGFERSGFGHGLGVGVITPLIDPPMAVPGGDPDPTTLPDVLVLGVAHEGEAAAYAVLDLIGHEVVNDRLGDAAFAATY